MISWAYKPTLNLHDHTAVKRQEQVLNPCLSEIKTPPSTPRGSESEWPSFFLQQHLFLPASIPCHSSDFRHCRLALHLPQHCDFNAGKHLSITYTLVEMSESQNIDPFQNS